MMFVPLSLLVGIACIVPAAWTRTEEASLGSNKASPLSRRLSSKANIDEILSFWTEEKMRAAVPIMPTIEATFQPARRLKTQPDGPPVTVSGTMGSLQKSAMAKAASDLLSNKQVFGSTGRHTYTTGKIFWDAGNNYYGMCSGAIITSTNKDMIVTAGHCCYDHDAQKFRINNNFVFVPAYDNGAQPYGKWAARYMTTFIAWTAYGDWNYDVCFVNLSPNSNNEHIQDLLGSQGIAQNYARNEPTYSFGYPLNLNGGQVMQYCSGTATNYQFGSDFKGQTIPCDMGGGCSGGPWLQDFSTSTGVGYVTSLNSFIVSNNPDHMNGPYFDSTIYSVYQQCSVK